MSGYPYNASFEAQFSPERQQEFIIQKLIRGIHTCALVRVLAVRPVADRVGFVDLLPLVQDVDTANIRIVQTPIFNVPYFQYQGGLSAIILAPEPGDIGLAMFAERDISNVKTTLQEGPAATARVYSSGDGLYIGGVLNPAPTQWIRFEPEAGGIDITAPAGVTINGVSFPGAGFIVADEAEIAGVTQSVHVHGGITPGGADTDGPHD